MFLEKDLKEFFGSNFYTYYTKLCVVSQSDLVAVVDIYRRDGDKLAENWVFIDLLHFWKQQGLDVLERMEKDITYRSPC